MSDTPDVIDAPSDLMRAARIVRSSSWPLDMAASMEALADRLDWLAGHFAAGYVLVQADGLSHGDELVQVEIDPITGEIGTQAAWVRRPVPENGDTQ